MPAPTPSAPTGGPENFPEPFVPGRPGGTPDVDPADFDLCDMDFGEDVVPISDPEEAEVCVVCVVWVFLSVVLWVGVYCVVFVVLGWAALCCAVLCYVARLGMFCYVCVAKLCVLGEVGF